VRLAADTRRVEPQIRHCKLASAQPALPAKALSPLTASSWLLRKRMTSSALSDLLVSKLNLQTIVLNIVSDKFLTAAIHHSLLD
jgi:hypothetical protein